MNAYENSNFNGLKWLQDDFSDDEIILHGDDLSNYEIEIIGRPEKGLYTTDLIDYDDELYTVDICGTVYYFRPFEI